MAENKTKIMIRIAMLTAAATILFLFDVPLPFVAPPFYELDLSNVASLIGGFAMGPMAGVSIEFLKNLINLMIDGSITGGVGELSNFLTSCAFVIPASVIYKMSKTKKSAFFGLVTGVVIMTVFGLFSNLFVMIPTYSKALKIPIDAIVSMGSKIHPSINSVSDLVWWCVVPFNLLKGVIVSAVTFVLYKKIRKIL